MFRQRGQISVSGLVGLEVTAEAATEAVVEAASAAAVSEVTTEEGALEVTVEVIADLAALAIEGAGERVSLHEIHSVVVIEDQVDTAGPLTEGVLEVEGEEKVRRGIER
jgi:hypothetical protein